MKPIVSDWTIVALGSWNLAILNPDWFARNILETPQIQVELIVENLATRFRFIHQSLTILPRTDRVIFGVREATPNALMLAERTAIRLLTALPVTPISAIGINFGFAVDEPSDGLARVFRLTDLSHFADRKLLIDETRIARRMPYDDRTLNFTMTLDGEGKVRFHANYHAQVAGADAAHQAIHDKTLAYLDHTSKMIADFYELGEGNDV